MTQFILSSAMTRFLANVFIFLCLVSALLVGVLEVLKGQPLNPLVYTLLSSGLIYGTSILSVHIGVVASGATPSVMPMSSTLEDMTRLDTASMPAARKQP